eukprot:TCALIF_07147-PA protein Name:"Similar to Spase12 Signal peptidase complex subunit 1 (Drosophila melanogaster)" AED:0.33 eAED:0.33 QI:202/0.5/0.66/0.66/0/0.33/3/0/128
MDFLRSIPTHMDFEGQARAENLSRIIVFLFGMVGLVWGYIIQQFSQTVYILAAGLALSILTFKLSPACLWLVLVRPAFSYRVVGNDIRNGSQCVSNGEAWLFPPQTSLESEVVRMRAAFRLLLGEWLL